MTLPIPPVSPIHGIHMPDIILVGIADFVIQMVANFVGAIAVAFQYLVSYVLIPLAVDFLFIRPGSAVPGVAYMFERSRSMAMIIYTILAFAFLFAYQVRPGHPELNLYDIVKRSFLAFLLMIMGPFMLDNTIRAVNIISRYLFPETFRLVLNTSAGAGGIVGAFNTIAGSLLAGIFAYLLFSMASLVGMLSLLMLLSLRALSIYIVYPLLPFFAVLWVFDIGPMEHVTTLTQTYLSMIGIVLVVPILISAILATGGAVAGADGTSGSTVDGSVGTDAFAASQPKSDLPRPAEYTAGETFAGQQRAESIDIETALVKIGFYFGSILLSVTVAQRFMGLLFSMGGLGNSARGTKKKSSDDDDSDDGDPEEEDPDEEDPDEGEVDPDGDGDWETDGNEEKDYGTEGGSDERGWRSDSGETEGYNRINDFNDLKENVGQRLQDADLKKGALSAASSFYGAQMKIARGMQSDKSLMHKGVEMGRERFDEPSSDDESDTEEDSEDLDDEEDDTDG